MLKYRINEYMMNIAVTAVGNADVAVAVAVATSDDACWLVQQIIMINKAIHACTNTRTRADTGVDRIKKRQQ